MGMFAKFFPVSSNPERAGTDPAKAHNPRSEYLFSRFALTRVFYTHTGIMPKNEHLLAGSLLILLVLLPLYLASSRGVMVALPVFVLWCLFYLFPILNTATKRMRDLGWRSEFVFLVLAWQLLLVAPPITDEKAYSPYALLFAAVFILFFWLYPGAAPGGDPAREDGGDKG